MTNTPHFCSRSFRSGKGRFFEGRISEGRFSEGRFSKGRISEIRFTALRGFFLLFSVALLVGANPAHSSAFKAKLLGQTFKVASKPMPKQVAGSLEALLKLPGGPATAYQEGMAQPLLAFIASKGLEVNEYTPPSINSTKSVAMLQPIDASLKKIIRYGYSPDIPAYLTTPSVIRVSGWYPGSQLENAEPGLWAALEESGKPVVISGTEFEEITPESSSGGYYRYDLSRTLVLTRFQGRPALISIAKQKGPSSVGKKGVVLEEDNWNYFYSGIDGLTTGGLSWMDTYMYDSFSVIVFMSQPGGEKTDYVVFKWLRAGWASLNVVKPSHIFRGCMRTASAFKAVIESSRLPEPDALAEKFRELSDMTDMELTRLLTPYAHNLEQIGREHPDMDEDDFQEILENGTYVQDMSREAKISVLMKDFMRRSMGKPSLVSENK